MILLIDNYDSFTYNLVHYLGELGEEVNVQRNDALSAMEAINLNAKAIVISPGPCTPNEAGICLELIGLAHNKRTPLLGVCLGHQAIGQFFGGVVKRAPEPIHGKVSEIFHTEEGVFQKIPSPFNATRYHSLIVETETLPPCLTITAKTSCGLIMGLQHKESPIQGVQFHPESIASEHGHHLLKNFIEGITA